MKRRTFLATLATITGAVAGCMNVQSATTGDGNAETPSLTAAPTTPMTSTPLVRGMIVFESCRPDLTGTTVYVQLEDISLADAPAKIVSEQVIRDTAERASAKGIPFVLPGSQADIDSQRRYSVAVHVDMDGTEDVTVGDYVSPDLNPVLTHGHPDTVTVSVEKVE